MYMRFLSLIPASKEVPLIDMIVDLLPYKYTNVYSSVVCGCSNLLFLLLNGTACSLGTVHS